MPGMVTVGGLVINMSADTAQLKSDMADGSRAVDSGAKAMINSLAGITESTGQVTDAGARMVNQLKAEIASFGMSNEQLAQQKANLAGVGAEYEMLTQRLNAMRSAQGAFSQDVAATNAALSTHGASARDAAGAVEEFGFKTAASKRELLVLAHELSQGNYKRFGGSMMVLAEQTGAAGALFSATGIAALAFGAAVVGVGASVLKGAEDQRAMSNALIETGNYAGLTSDSLNNLAHAAVASGGSISEAKKAVTELAGTGKFTGDQIGIITDAAVAMEHAGGQSIDKTIASFESLAVETTGSSMRSSEAISKAAVKLNEQYHFLTESVYEQIRALEKEGDQKAASAVATEALAKVTKDRAAEMEENIGSIHRGWNTVKDVIAEVVDGLGKIGMKSTAATDAAKASAKLASFDDGLKTVGITDPEHQLTGNWAETRKKLVLDLVAAYGKLNEADAAAIAKGKEQAAQSEATIAASRIEQDNMRLGKKGATELDDAIQKYGEDLAKIAAANPGSELLNQDAVNQHMALIIKAHTVAKKGNDDRAALLQDALTNEQAGLDREKSIYDARDKMLDLYHSKFGLSDADFYAGREAARAEYVASEAITFAKESALMKAAQSQATNPQEVAAAKGKYDQLVKAHEKFVDDMRNAGGLDSASADANAKKQYEDTLKTINDAGEASIKSLDEQIAKQKEHNAEIGKTKEQIELARKAQVDAATAQLQSDADDLRDELASADLDDQGIARAKLKLHYLDAQITRRQTLAGLDNDGADAEAMAKASADLDKYLDPTKATSFGEALKSSLGGAAKAMGDLTNLMMKYGQQQAANEAKRAEAAILMKGNDQQRAKGLADLDAINQRSTQQQLESYADIAGAAAGFFDKGSRGYKALQTASEVMHAAELAMNLASIAPAMAAGAAQFFAQSGWGGFAGVAAMGAVIAGFGVAVSGGSDANVAQTRQAAQGTGTVLGDSSAKSDSVNKAIELTAANSSTQINYLASLNATLKTIQSDITSFTSELVQTTDVTGKDISGLNTNNGLASTVGTIGLSGAGAVLGATGAAWTAAAGSGIAASALAELGSAAGPLGAIAGALVGAIASKIPAISNLMTSIFGGKQSLEDSGFMLDKTTLASVLANGVNAESYADIHTSGGLFHGSSDDEKTTALGADANRQFTSIIDSLATSVTQAAGLLGVSGDAFTEQLNSFVIDIGHVSLKGLTGDDLNKAIEAVFSKLGDQLAQAAIPDLTQFQQVGEGYLETLVRVASDYAKVDASLQSIGMTFGAVGVASIAARENLISLTGGIDDFQSKTADFASNFLTTAQQQAPVLAYVNQQLASLGLTGVTTREQFAQVVTGLDLTTTSGQETYAALMNLESAFAATHAAIVDTSMSMQDIADQRKDLQDQLDDATMTSEQLRAKELATIDASNVALYNQVQAAKTASSMLDLQGQVYQALGDRAGAAAVLEQQHALALAQTDPALRALTQQLWDLQAAATVKQNLLADVDNAFSALQNVVQREKDVLQQRITDQQDVVQAQQSINDSIKSTLTQIQGNTVALAESRAQAEATVATLQAKLSSGSLSDADKDALTDAMSVLTQDSKGLFTNRNDYLFDQYKAQAQLQALKDTSDDQLTDAQKQLNALQAQSDSLDDVLNAAQQQVNILKGIDTTGESILTALNTFGTAVTAAQSNAAVSADVVKGLYEEFLGRDPDASGSAYWQQQLQNGTSATDVATSISTSREAQIRQAYESIFGRAADQAGLQYWFNSGASIADIEASMMQSQEYKDDIASGKIKAFAAGGDFGGGIRLVGENGPEIEVTGPARYFNASQTRNILQGSSNADTTRLLQQALSTLNDNVTNLRAETRAVATHSSKTASLLKRVIRNDSLITAGADS